MSAHPRWRLISTFEVITVVDLAKLCSIIQKNFHPSIYQARPLEDEEKLDQMHEDKKTNKY